MNNLYFLVLFFSLGIIYFLIGLRASKGVKNDADYFVGGRSLGTLQVSCNLIATQLGGGLLLGTAASAYQIGISSLFYSFGIALGLLILGLGIGEKIQGFKAITAAELFETQYGSVRLKWFASTLSILTLFGILTAQVIALESLIVSLGFSPWVSSCLWLIVTLYTMVGGIRAITFNDMLQLGIIVTTFGSIFVVTLFKSTDAVPLLIQASQSGIFHAVNFRLDQAVGIVLLPALFCLIEQDMVQRFFASRTPRVARTSALLSFGFIFLFALIPAFFGMMARVNEYAVSEKGSPLLAFLRENTSPLIMVCAVCAVFAAIISTADALINAVSANLSQDFTWKLTAAQKRMLPRILSLLTGMGALVASSFMPSSIIDVLVSSYEVSVSGLLIPLLYVYFGKPLGSRSAWFSVCAGTGCFFVLYLIPEVPYRILFSLFASFAGYQLGSLGKELPTVFRTTGIAKK